MTNQCKPSWTVYIIEGLWVCLFVCVYLLRNHIRQYPALVNCTTIDWFSEWPRDALLEVAERFLDGLSLGSEDGVRHINRKMIQWLFYKRCQCITHKSTKVYYGLNKLNSTLLNDFWHLYQFDKQFKNKEIKNRCTYNKSLRVSVQQLTPPPLPSQTSIECALLNEFLFVFKGALCCFLFVVLSVILDLYP